MLNDKTMASVNQNAHENDCARRSNHSVEDHNSQQCVKRTYLSMKCRKLMNCHLKNAFVIILFVLPMLANGQISIFSTRDPRYYNREGDFHYRWPNPGDPDYR